MSDVERPSNEKGPSGKPGQGLPARNMADIARMFLDGARPVDAGRSPAARRVPPAARELAPVKKAIEKPVTARRERTGTMLGLAAAAHESASWKLLVRAAQGIADEQSTTVGVVGLLPSGGGWNFVLDVVGLESAEELPPLKMPAQAAHDADMHVARAIHSLRPAVGMWIVASPRPDSRAFPAIAGIVSEWLLACATDNEGLVAGYQHLKSAWKRCGKSEGVVPSAFLFSDDYAHASQVHKRLRKAAQEFLKTDLSLAGTGPIRASHAPIRVVNLACTGPEDSLWAAILDELCPMEEAPETQARTDIEAALEHLEGHAEELSRHSVNASTMVLDHLAQVLDPEERAALSAAFEEPGVPVATAQSAAPASMKKFDVTEQVPPAVVLKSTPPARPAASGIPRAVPAPVALVEPREAVQPAEETAGTSLRAFDLDTCKDRQSQWQAVERSIWDLSPRSALLEARPPMSWASETCISIDGQGRVNVWTLYKDGASWFALREWANEHRNLLALTRRDLAISKEAEVAVHIVMPLEDESANGAAEKPSVIGTLMRTPSKGVHLYRLRTVQWDDRRGLVVVPMG